MIGTAVKTGQTVTTRYALDAHKRYVPMRSSEIDGVKWTVLDRAPERGSWYLHRWEGNTWISCISHARDLDLVKDPYRVGGKVQGQQLELI